MEFYAASGQHSSPSAPFQNAVRIARHLSARISRMSWRPPSAYSEPADERLEPRGVCTDRRASMYKHYDHYEISYVILQTSSVVHGGGSRHPCRKASNAHDKRSASTTPSHLRNLCQMKARRLPASRGWSDVLALESREPHRQACKVQQRLSSLTSWFCPCAKS